MTLHSQEAISTNLPGGAGGTAMPASRWLALLSSTQGLLSHVGLMLAVTASLALINLVVNPNALWSRAILVIWLVVLVAHAIGIVILRLLNDDTNLVGSTPRVQAEPHLGAFAPWTQPDGTQASASSAPEGSPEQPDQVDPWKDVAAPSDEAEISWPRASTATTESEQAPADIAAKRNGVSTNANEKVPWRAATEIAWLRKRGDADHAEPDQRDSGS